MHYEWKSEELGGDAQAVGKELERIADVSGELEPHAVVDAARSEASPLHDYFEWDDSEAAEQYRQHQARHLIRSIRVVCVAGEEPPTTKIKVKIADAEVKARKPSEPRQRERSVVDEALDTARNGLQALERKCADIQPMLPLVHRQEVIKATRLIMQARAILCSVDPHMRKVG